MRSTCQQIILPFFYFIFPHRPVPLLPLHLPRYFSSSFVPFSRLVLHLHPFPSSTNQETRTTMELDLVDGLIQHGRGVHLGDA